MNVTTLVVRHKNVSEPRGADELAAPCWPWVFKKVEENEAEIAIPGLAGSCGRMFAGCFRGLPDFIFT